MSVKIQLEQPKMLLLLERRQMLVYASLHDLPSVSLAEQDLEIRRPTAPDKPVIKKPAQIR
ncbi:hypothetical protein D3C78_1807850 [compost metagenome]